MAENNKPDRAYGRQIHNKAIEYIRAGRFNIDFREDIIKRRDLLQDKITILPIDDAVKEKLLNVFSFPPSDSDIDNTLSKFASCKTKCRNEWGAEYWKGIAVEHSGDYDDENLIKSILRKTIVDKIDDNLKKAASAAAVVQGKTTPAPTKDQIAEFSKNYHRDKKEQYDLKKSKWQEDDLPNEFLAFVLGGKPGLKLTVFEVGIEESVPKSKDARRENI